MITPTKKTDAERVAPPFTIGLDFDDTVVANAYPRIGEEAFGAVQTLREVVARGARILLWTMRSGELLEEAVAWLQERGVPVWSANDNPEQRAWTDSPKAHCDVYVDDRAIGCPMALHRDRMVVDWHRVREMLHSALDERVEYSRRLPKRIEETAVSPADRAAKANAWAARHMPNCPSPRWEEKRSRD